MNTSSSKNLTGIISDLGGPVIADTDIEWALDLPAGKKLVEWLAAQLGNEDEEFKVGDDKEGSYREKLGAIALEVGETDILKHIGPSDVIDTEESKYFPIGYIPPSRLKKQAEHINNDIHLWEEEARLLKIRSHQTKLASQKISESARLLRAAIETETGNIAEIQDRLGDLSLHGDTAISSTVKSAQSLLDVVGCDSESTIAECSSTDTKLTSDLATAVNSLSNLASLRSSIIDLHALQFEQLDEGCLKMPNLETLKEDAAHLQAILTPQFHESVSEAAFLQELENMCTLLESDDINDEKFQQILDADSRSSINQELDVYDVLEVAWSLDQAKILDAKGQILQKTISAYKNDLAEPLKGLQHSLSIIEKQARDSEALIGTLGIELEEIVDDIRGTKENSEIASPSSIEDSLDEELETKLLVVLKDLKDLRTSDAPPLVLLQRADIIQELKSIVYQTETLQEQEQTLSTRLPLALSAMKSMHTPLLSQVYEHSPVNTSPPFSLPSDIVRLRDKAKYKGDDLASNVGQLQKDLDSLMASSRTKRKLSTFIDKWHKTA